MVTIWCKCKCTYQDKSWVLIPPDSMTSLLTSFSSSAEEALSNRLSPPRGNGRHL